MPSFFVTTLTVAQLEIIPRHGVPRQLLSDWDSAFLSKLMIEISENSKGEYHHIPPSVGWFG